MIHGPDALREFYRLPGTKRPWNYPSDRQINRWERRREFPTLPLNAAVAFVNANTANRTAGGSLSRSVTASATGANHIALAFLAYDLTDPLTVSAITIGGNAMTSCGAAVRSDASSGGNFTWVQAFYRMNAGSGSLTLAATVTGANEIYSGFAVFSGVDATTPIVNYTTATPGSAATGSITVTSTANQMTCSVASVSDGFTFTGTNQTSMGINTGGALTMGYDRCTTPGSSITHTWTADGSPSHYAIAAFSLLEDGGGGGATTKRLAALGVG